MATIITFDGMKHTLTFGDESYTAYNNVDSKSLGKWPNGTYAYERFVPHPNDTADDTYGPDGNIVFGPVLNRTNMGIHAGRANRPDGLHRVGPECCTFGCIRTTAEAVRAIHALGKNVKLTVQNN